MNTTTIMPLLLSATLAVASTTALADDNADVGAFAVQKTRAEVIADMQIWRDSGLAALQATDSADVHSHDYLQARQRYERMHASPQFDALVEQIARERGESFTAAKR